jgi:hypothetical protein
MSDCRRIVFGFLDHVVIGGGKESRSVGTRDSPIARRGFSENRVSDFEPQRSTNLGCPQQNLLVNYCDSEIVVVEHRLDNSLVWWDDEGAKKIQREHEARNVDEREKTSVARTAQDAGHRNNG